MSVSEHIASTIGELVGLTTDPAVGSIIVRGEISSPTSVRLAPGQSLRGEDAEAKIAFAPGSDGIELSTDNQVHALQVRASAERRDLQRHLCRHPWVDLAARCDLHGARAHHCA